jgi:hypothetical protein
LIAYFKKLNFRNQTAMIKRYLSIFLPFVLVSGLFLQPKTAHADCVSEAVSCVVNAIESQYYALSALGPVLKFTAEHPQCVTAITSQDYTSIGVMGVVGGLSAAGAIGASESGCHNDLYGEYAGQLAGALSSIIPNDKLKAIAKGELQGNAVRLALNTVPVPATTPGLQVLGEQLNCGCAVASTGAGAVERIKQAINSAGKAAKACAGTFSCLGKDAVKAITVVGDAFVQTGKCIGGPNDCGEQPPMPEIEYYKFYFEPFVPLYVDAQLDGLGVRPDDSAYGYQLKNISQDQKLENIRSECVDYYLNHRYSGGTLSTGNHAQDACNNMRDNLFFPAARALRSTKMDNEVFPKKMLGYMMAKRVKHVASCDVPSKSKEASSTSVNADGSITLAAGETAGVNTYGSAQQLISDDCKQQINKLLGLNADANNNGGVLVGQPGSAAYDIKNTYKNNNFDIEGTANKLLASGSSYDAQIKKIIETAQGKMFVGGLFNTKNVLLNKAYAKFAEPKWQEYRAKCPAKNSNPNSLNARARIYCINETAEFIGITIAKVTDTNPADDLGALDFNLLKNMPDVYSLAQKSFAEQGDGATQELADSRVQLAFATSKSKMDAILPNAIGKAKDDLAPIRQKQEQAYEDKINKLTDAYANAQKCDLTLSDTVEYASCQYSPQALAAMFDEWNKRFESLANKKDILNKTVENGIPFPDKATDTYPLLLTAIDASTKASKQAYNDITKQPNAVIKVNKTIDKKSTQTKAGFAQINTVDKATKDKKAQTLDNSGLRANGDSTPSLKNQVKDAGIGDALTKPATDNSQTARPTVRGMRAAPGMVAVAPAGNQVPSSPVAQRPPVAVASVNDTQQAMTERAEAQPLKDNKSTATGFDTTKNIGSKPMLPQDPAGQNPHVQEMPKSVDVANNNNPGNLRDVASKPAGNLGVSVAASTGTANQRGVSGLPPATSTPPPVKAISNNAPLTSAAKAPEPPFDRNLYQRITRQKLEAKWQPQCKNETCKTDISSLVTNRINEVLRMLDTGTDLRVKAALDNTEVQMDIKYNPLMQAKVDASSKIIRNEPVVPVESAKPIGNKPIKKMSL